MKKAWDLIVITCSQSFLADIEEEVKYLKKKLEILHHTSVLTVEDPVDNIGSGAATLNALLFATECLSAQNDYAVVTADVLTEAHVLIFHMGRECAYSNCGNAFITLPLPSHTKYGINGNFCFNIELLLNVLEKLKENSLPGIWVCSTDMSLLMLDTDVYIPWERNPEAIMFCVPVQLEYATNHGTVRIDKQGFVADIIYCGSNAVIQQCKQDNGLVPIVSGIVYLSSCVAESLLSLHMQSPFQSCTYVGLDSGLDGVQVSLYFDILIAMATNINETMFLSGKCGNLYNMKAGFYEDCVQAVSLSARTLVWQELSKYKMATAILGGFQHLYWSDHFPASEYISNVFSITDNANHDFNLSVQCSTPNSEYLLINSDVTTENCIISSGVIIVNSKVNVKSFSVGENCYISGIHIADFEQPFLEIPKDLMVINYLLHGVDETSITITFGIHDKLQLPITDQGSTFANKPWTELFKWCNEDYIWDSEIERSKKTLLNAKMYATGSCPNFIFLLVGNQLDANNLLRWKLNRRYSIAEVLANADYSKQFSFQSFNN